MDNRVKASFLFAFIAFALASCGSSYIVVRSEVGEQLAVKKSTISEISNSQDIPVFDILLETSRDFKEDYCRKALGFSAIRDFYQEQCEKHTEEVSMEEAKLEAQMAALKLDPWFKKFRYIPIFTDINGQKKVMQEAFVVCTKKDLSGAESALIDTADWNEYIQYHEGSSVGEGVKRRICSQFARF